MNWRYRVENDWEYGAVAWAIRIVVGVLFVLALWGITASLVLAHGPGCPYNIPECK